MELVDLLSQVRPVGDEGVGPEVMSFVFKRALPPASPKPRIVMSMALVSMGYRGFCNGF